MYSLFIDSTAGLTIGLLDSKYSWIEYITLDEKKPSEIIHHEVYNIIKKHKLSLKEMQCFVSNGPGSYTGMRLGEGLAQVFELNKIPVYSFYHFEIPQLSGMKNGFWATNAFKGQVFVYSWTETENEKHLVNKENFMIDDISIGFTLDTTDVLFSNLISTKELIKLKPSSIFHEIYSKKQRKPPYYFRELSEEFS